MGNTSFISLSNFVNNKIYRGKVRIAGCHWAFSLRGDQQIDNSRSLFKESFEVSPNAINLSSKVVLSCTFRETREIDLSFNRAVDISFAIIKVFKSSYCQFK